jgi:lambda family phage portal protein
MTVSLADMQMSARGEPGVKAHYDAAQTTYENAAHWSFSNALSADRINSRQVRSTLRNRARYELSNNCYAGGIVHFIADEVVGRDIHLLMGAGVDEAVATWAEGEFHEWLQAIDGIGKLNLLTFAQVADGESFGVITTNPGITTPVKADLLVYECDFVQLPAWAEMFLDPRNIDGIRIDKYGQPVVYQFLRQHPGSMYGGVLVDADPIPADRVIHLFKPTRPGQHRGVSELAAALPLFAQLRRWTLAVIAAAETAADIAGIIKSNVVDVDPNGSGATPFDRVEIERRALMTLPDGYDIHQFKAEQPVSTYKEFKREIVAEIARSVSVPVGVALGDHAGFNYSSAKLDNQLWHKVRRVRRSLLRRQALDRLLYQWRREAELIPGYMPAALRNPEAWTGHDWLMDGDEFADPLKEANGQKVRLESLTTNLSIECAKHGLDWEDVLRQRAREKALIKELGLAAAAVQPDEDEPDEDEPDEDGEQDDT